MVVIGKKEKKDKEEKKEAKPDNMEVEKTATPPKVSENLKKRVGL